MERRTSSSVVDQLETEVLISAEPARSVALHQGDDRARGRVRVAKAQHNLIEYHIIEDLDSRFEREHSCELACMRTAALH